MLYSDRRWSIRWLYEKYAGIGTWNGGGKKVVAKIGELFPPQIRVYILLGLIP